ncbi:MAG: hypothetical protein HKM03_12300 [Steroidobacteraceae bacterium]|nr:hypothetical protein [Steroidobacteraceae bacterium]
MGCGGYALLGEGTAELKRLFVDPVTRGRGVGMAIVRAIAIRHKWLAPPSEFYRARMTTGLF